MYSQKEVVRKFVGQIAKAFDQCGPIPVFDIVKRGEKFEVTKLRDLRYSIVPIIVKSKVHRDDLGNPNFQNAINRWLEKDPIILDGRNDLTFRLKSGRRAVMHNVSWQLAIYHISSMEMDEFGTIKIKGFDFRDESPYKKTDKELKINGNLTKRNMGKIFRRAGNKRIG